MTTQPPYPCIPLSQVADSSTLWGLILEEVTHPEGADQPIQADDRV
jgi:hypothetical protein